MICVKSFTYKLFKPLGYISIHISFIIYCYFIFYLFYIFIALWNSDVIDYRKNIILLIILFIFNKLFHGNQVQLSFPLPAIDFYVVICLIITIVFYIRRKNGESKTYFKS